MNGVSEPFNVIELLSEIQARLEQELNMTGVNEKNLYCIQIKKLQKKLVDISYPTANLQAHLTQLLTRLNEWKEESQDICKQFSISETSLYRFFNHETANQKGVELLEYLDMIEEQYIIPNLRKLSPP